MRGEVPIKYVLRGDREAGKLYMRRGAVLMDMLVHGMTYQGLKQSVMRRWVTPDVLIECDCRFGLRTVTITVAPVTPETIVTQQADVFYHVVVSVSCSSGLFMHHGDWKCAEFTGGIHQYTHHEPVPNGWHFNGTAGGTIYHSHYMDAWANVTGTPRWPTKPHKFYDRVFNHFVTQTGQGTDRDDARYAWNTPVVMPGFDGKDYMRAINILFDKDDARISDHDANYEQSDLLRLSELALQKKKQDGRQEPTSKWVFATRGYMSDYGNSRLFDIAPMPARDDVRRFVCLPVQHSMTPAIFSHVSVRSKNDVRNFDFTEEMMRGVFPAEFELSNRTAKNVFNGHAYMDDAGVVHVSFGFHCDAKSGVAMSDQTDAATNRWIGCVIFVTIPALTKNMTVDEEREYILENMTVRGLSWGEFLPLLDHLHDFIFELPGGRGSFDDGQRILLQAETWGEDDYGAYHVSTTRPEYTIDGVTYHAGRMKYDIDRCYMWEDHAALYWEGIVVRTDAARYMLYYALGDNMPADSVMFHCGDAAQWYSWTRMWGGLSITPEAISQVEMTMPPETGTDGVKPDMTWAGNGMYCCVCFNTCTRRVLAVYIGTPFATAEREAWWQKIPLAQAGYDILHVRPALVSPERVVLLAIVDDNGHCRAAYCDGHPETAELKLCGAIPLGRENEEGMTLDICDFGDGDGEYAELLRVYPSPPSAKGGLMYSNIYKYRNSVNPSWFTGWSEFEETWW